MLFLYNLGISLYALAVRIASFRNSKAAMWVNGRRDWRDKMKEVLEDDEPRIWIHCASLGEFEQGRPLIDLLREQYPGHKIVLTFFSPSGYEICARQDIADYIFYLPIDTAANARDFLALVRPQLAIFVKYEFWYHFLHQLRKRNVPTILVSAAFREQQLFFTAWGGFFRKMLRFYSHLHVQDEKSANLLKGIGVKNVSVSGDTRYDRVSAIAKRLKDIPLAQTFKEDHKILIAGSTWPADEDILAKLVPQMPTGWRTIIAPHEIDAGHIDAIQKLFPDSVLYSRLREGELITAKVLIIDNIGLLSSLYAWGDVAWVGGGFAKSGIHNTLEPAIFGLPVLMGPVYQKFVEAVALVEAGCAFAVANEQQASDMLDKLTTDELHRQQIAEKMKLFMDSHTGAAARIMAQITNAGWLSESR